MSDVSPLARLSEQSAWYGKRAGQNRFRYNLLKSIQLFLAAAIPVVAVAGASNMQRWATAILGASIGVVEGLIQLGQYQQNWLLYRATREALNREEFLHGAKAGPYSDAPDPERLFIERCDAIMSGENSKWLATQQQAGAKKSGPQGQG